MGAEIYGISFDTPEDNRGWAEMMEFDFPLLSDPDQRVGELLMATRGRLHPLNAFPRRVTFLIDPEGIIRKTYEVSRDSINDHPTEVLADLTLMADDEAGRSSSG